MKNFWYVCNVNGEYVIFVGGDKFRQNSYKQPNLIQRIELADLVIKDGQIVKNKLYLPNKEK